MRYLLFLFIIAALTACAPVRPVSELRDHFDEKRTSLLQQEKELSTPFIETRTFHQGLMAVVGDKSQKPYKQLDSLFNESFTVTNQPLMGRMLADERYDALLRSFGEKEKFRLNKKTKEQITSVDNIYSISSDFFDSCTVKLKKYVTEYKELCAANGITRKDHFDMLELMGKRLYQFQDSLEMQGFKLSSCKRHLQSTGLKLGMPDFQVHYKIISEIELLHKQYQQLLIQLENSFARFESGNPEELYYTGPFILPRVDITVYNELLSELTIEMQRFREMELDYYSSFLKH